MTTLNVITGNNRGQKIMNIKQAIEKFKTSDDYCDYCADAMLYHVAHWLECNNLTHCRDEFVKQLSNGGKK